MTVSHLYARRPDVPTAEFDDELAVMDLRSGSYLSFNRTAADIWRLLEQPRSFDYLCTCLAERYHVDAETISGDIGALLDRLGELGVLEKHCA